MKNGDIARITKDLEDLLMTEGKKDAALTGQPQEGKTAPGQEQRAEGKLQSANGTEPEAAQRPAAQRVRGMGAAKAAAWHEMQEQAAARPGGGGLWERRLARREAAVSGSSDQAETQEDWAREDKQMQLRQEAAVRLKEDQALAEDVQQEIEEEKEQEEKQLGRGAHTLSCAGSGCSRNALIAAFAVPVLIMILIFIQRGIFPFGEESFLRTDMYHQYAPFFSEFRYKLTHGGSLLYSWDVGMGVNFSALYAYYLASPFNWLLLLCPAGLVIEFMTGSIVIKIGLAGLSMAWYLRKHCETEDFGVAYFGIFYALSGYMAAYSWNIMWLDCIVLFPLIALGLERLVKKGKGLFYCVMLGLSILSNYYISIMTCIFMVIYFAALLVLENRMSWRRAAGRCLRFAVYSLLAGGLAAAVLLPEIYALQMTASGDFSFPKTVSQYFPIFDMLARHIGNVQTEIGLDHWPNLYCGVAVLMLFGLYLANRKIPLKEKAVYCLMLLFFLASFSINVLNFIWHGFHYPNSLPCRQSYIYIFLVLVVCYRAYTFLLDTPWRQVTAAFAGAAVFLLLAQKLVTEPDFHFAVFYAALLFLSLYLALIAMYQRRPRRRFAAMLCGLLLVATEAAVNTAVTSVTTTSRTAYTADNQAVEKLVSSVMPNETFFRMDKVPGKTKNDGAWMHFPSVSLFSSTANADLSKLFKKLGCESSTNAYSINGGTPLIDALFSVKYEITSEEQEDSSLHSLLRQEGDTYLYENRNTLSLGFGVSEDFEELWNLELGNPADVQNSLADAVGAGVVLETMLNAPSSGQTLTFYPEKDGEYYVYVSNRKIEQVAAATMLDSKTFTNVDRGYLLDLGWCYAGEEVTLTAQDTQETLTADVYRFSENGLESVCEALSREPWRLTSWTDTQLKGTIDMEESGLMLTTIPYDRGWKIVVDGAEQPAVKMLDAFVGVRLSPGSHTISMTYRPEGLRGGLGITAVSLVLLAAAAAGERRYSMGWKETKGDEYDGPQYHEKE